MNEAKRDVSICIGATIAIIVSIVILGRVFDVDVEYGLGFVGFWFLVGLPTYILYRKHRSEKELDADNELYMRRVIRQEVLDEIWEYLDESIEKFKEWGREIKDFEKTDERAYYAEIALWREAGMDAGKLSVGYGKDVSCLISIQRMLMRIE